MQEIVEWPLAADEQNGLMAAAGIVADAVRPLG
jgi:hypothetical protein